MYNVEHPLLATDAARVLDLSAARVRQLDAQLKPLRTPGGTRVYSLARVLELREQREGSPRSAVAGGNR